MGTPEDLLIDLFKDSNDSNISRKEPLYNQRLISIVNNYDSKTSTLSISKEDLKWLKTEGYYFSFIERISELGIKPNVL